MLDAPWKRIALEVSLAAFGGDPLDAMEPWAFDRLVGLLERKDVRSGQILWRVGSPVEFLYFMHQGKVRMEREDVPPWTFEGRWLLGGFEGHVDSLASRDLVALTDFEVLRAPRRQWFDLLEDSPELAQRSVIAMAGALARLEERLPQLPRPTRIPSDVPGRIDTITKLAFLTELGMAYGAGVQALADMAIGSRVVELGKGQALYAAGEDHRELYLVVNGEIETWRTDPALRRKQGAGELVTGAAAFAGRQQLWSAQATRPSRLLAIPIESWFDLMEEHFDFLHSTIAVLGRQRELVLDQLARTAGPNGIML